MDTLWSQIKGIKESVWSQKERFLSGSIVKLSDIIYRLPKIFSNLKQ